MILQGDCIKEMKKMEENSIDAIITDPPYGLEFMGKDWDKFGISEGRAKRLTGSDSKGTGDRFFDHREGASERGRYSEMTIPEKTSMQMFMQVWAIECLRVLKPGGFLLAFGGTRTYHRLVCGIEDAGFEIRDTIMWLYGSGFPKSLNIGKQVDKLNGKRQEEFIALGKYIKKQRLKLKLAQSEISKNFPSKTGGLTGCVSNWEKGCNVPTKKQWIILKEKLKLDNKFDYIIEREEAEREVIGKDGRGELKEDMFFSQNIEKAKEKGKSIGYGEWDLTKAKLPEAKQWEGWETALKPACEPIVVARKPLSEKNVALNVLKWGTGGINLDDCRIGSEIIKEHKLGDTSLMGGLSGKSEQGGYISLEHQGRFPTNIILDEEAGKLMPDDMEEYDNLKQQTLMGEVLEPENKSASRFFYCAKASKSERNFGCEEMEDKTTDDGREVVSNRPHQRGTTQRKNNHPTVKPIKLMEYLVKLVSKEGATVLDPFLGSGTTLIACVKLGRKGIGIEKEAEYCEIAKSRTKPYTEQTKL